MSHRTRSVFLTLDNRQIEYRFTPSANPALPTLIFLHEGLGCVALWRDFPDQLAAATGCGVLIYSRLGYGQSDPCELPRPVNYHHIEAAQTLPNIIATLGIGDHILIGHSDGGTIALIYAGSSPPSTLRGVITEAAHVTNEAGPRLQVHKMARAYRLGYMRKKMHPYHRDVDVAFWGWHDIWTSEAFLDWTIEAILPAINVPLLVIQGLNDNFSTLAQVEKIIAGVGTHLTESLLISDCRHAPHHEQPTTVLAKMTEFIVPD